MLKNKSKPTAKKKSSPRAAAAKGNPRKDNSTASQWSPRLAKAGHTRVVNSFLDNYSRLQFPLTSSEAVFVIQIMRHKWTEEAPYPSLKTIARRMGMSDTAVRKIARKLEGKRYLRRRFRTGATNKFNFEPLFEALEGAMDTSKSRAKRGAKQTKESAAETKRLKPKAVRRR